MKQILLLDDDPITHSVVKGVMDSEYKVVSCYTIQEAEEQLENLSQLSLIIIDRQLPDGDGLSVCARVRSTPAYNHLPIIFLSIKDTETDKVTGLFAGADDYVAKPFSPLELKARIQARLRSEGGRLSYGPLWVDLASHRVFLSNEKQNREIELTKKEFKILVTLLQNPDRLFTREDILNKAWGDNTHVSDRAVDTNISHLRKKIIDSGLTIEARRGEGYKIVFEQEKSKAQAA